MLYERDRRLVREAVAVKCEVNFLKFNGGHECFGLINFIFNGDTSTTIGQAC